MIYFHSENDYGLPNESEVRKWISKSIVKLGRSIGDINYIFCNDDYLLNINQEYLKHDTYTDIVSFDYSDETMLSGDIFISTERVQENATFFKTVFLDELHRVLIHGLLHFVGYKDKTDKQKLEMRKQEDYYLSLRTF